MWSFYHLVVFKTAKSQFGLRLLQLYSSLLVFYNYDCLLFKLLFTYGRINGILTYLELHKYSVYNNVLSYT